MVMFSVDRLHHGSLPLGAIPWYTVPVCMLPVPEQRLLQAHVRIAMYES